MNTLEGVCHLEGEVVSGEVVKLWPVGGTGSSGGTGVQLSFVPL